MKNKSHHKSSFKRRQTVKQVSVPRRHGPRRNFPCACCKYVSPVRYGKVLTITYGKKLEVCSDCLVGEEALQISHCANCGNDYPQKGVKLVDVGSNASLTLCQSCFDSRKGISEYFDGDPCCDAESVF